MKIYDIISRIPLNRNLHLAIETNSKLFDLYVEENTGNSFYVFPRLVIADHFQFSNLKDYLAFHPSFKHFPDGYTANQINNIPGMYYPRIFRPTLRRGYYGTNTLRLDQLLSIHYKDDSFILTGNHSINYTNSLQNLTTLKNRLINIFENIYPSEDNYNCYGYEIRNLLILACTEVESQMKGILIANGYEVKTEKAEDKHKFSTNHYVKLLNILKLNDYSITLPFYNGLENIRPFKDWTTEFPSNTLQWYNAYNLTKHNNDLNFNKATLINAVNAVCAVYVLLISQYGNRIPYLNELIGNFFQLRRAPVFQLEDCYLPPFRDQNWESQKYFSE